MVAFDTLVRFERAEEIIPIMEDIEEKPIKVNILGTEYQVIINKDSNNPKMKNRAGYIEAYSKEIFLKDIEVDEDTYKNIEEFQKKVLRHEMMHAFFHEAGLEHYYEDENLVDWLALQIPKIIKAMNEVDCL